MIHIQAPIANAIRRIMIAEVLTQITIDPNNGYS